MSNCVYISNNGVTAACRGVNGNHFAANNINCFLSQLVDFLLTSTTICHKSANLDGTCELCRLFVPANCCTAAWRHRVLTAA